MPNEYQKLVSNPHPQFMTFFGPSEDFKNAFNLFRTPITLILAVYRLQDLIAVKYLAQVPRLISGDFRSVSIEINLESGISS